MISQKLIDNLTDSIMDIMKTNLPTGIIDQVLATRKELQKNLHALLQGVFSRLDLVTREEFDAQKIVLETTKKKLETMQTLLLQIEKQINSTTKAASSISKQTKKKSAT